jgi:hypothetical protein
MVFYRNIKTHSRFVLNHNLSFKFFLLSKLLSDDAGNGVSTCILQAIGNQKFAGVADQLKTKPNVPHVSLKTQEMGIHYTSQSALVEMRSSIFFLG